MPDQDFIGKYVNPKVRTDLERAPESPIDAAITQTRKIQYTAALDTPSTETHSTIFSAAAELIFQLKKLKQHNIETEKKAHQWDQYQKSLSDPQP